MAAGFKVATVNASDVPATQTNFPSYVDLSRLGITTLAEAQSVRVYADSSKTTEWAREIVSATEMHVKIPSLTSTTSIYVDWDGSSADYAVTDTYGRNTVWSGKIAQWHFDESSGNATDSKSSKVLTNQNVTYSTGKIGNSALYNQANPTSEGLYTTSYSDFNFGVSSPFSFTMWVKRTSSATSNQMLFAHKNYGANWVGYSAMINTVSGVETVKVDLTNTSTAGFTVATTAGLSTSLTKVDITYDGSGSYTGLKIYFDGVLQTVTNTGTTVTGTMTNTERFHIGTWGNTNQESRFQGNIDEFGVTGSALSANWITTEYNNQSDEAGFWGTWSTVGGGSTFVPHVVGMV